MTLWQDIRFAGRLLRKDRWFTLAAGIALALGIGANTAVFSFVNAVLIRGLPFEDPDRILFVNTQNSTGGNQGVAYLDFEDWRAARTISGFAAVLTSTINVADEGRPPEQFQGSYVSANLFQLIGQKTALGRDFRPEDDRIGAEPVVIIGDGIWKNRYGGDPAVIGRTIKANSLPVTVVGIMPPDMKFPNGADVWVPRAQLPAETRDAKRDTRNFNVVARLAAGATLSQAQAEMKAIGSRLAQEYPATNKDVLPRVVLYNDQVNGGPIRLVFLTLMGAVGFVLLIACANVANLLLARSAQRAREISVRVSLGASRWRIVRQLLIESVMLAVMSGLVGFGLSMLGIRWFDAATADTGRPYWLKFNIDPTVIAFFALVCLGTGILFGLAPALHVSRTNVNEILKEGGRGGIGGLRARRWTSALVVVEVALTIVLLAGAGFMMRSFLTLYRMDVGVDTSRLLTMRLYLPLTKYPQPGPRALLFQQFEERLRSIRPIEASALATSMPLQGGPPRQLSVDGRPARDGEKLPNVTVVIASDSYFDAVGATLVRGRPFDAGDGLPGHEAVIINQRLASLYFPGEDPIGRRIKLTSPAPGSPAAPLALIVGVSPNIRQRPPQQDSNPDSVAYLPLRSDPQRGVALIVRTREDQGTVTELVREAMREIEPDLPLFSIMPFDRVLAQQRWPFRVFGSMFVIFATIALALAAVGLYAVTAYSVTQRTQEIGVRMALGAQTGQVAWLVVRRAFIQLMIGLPIGIAGAIGVGQLLRSLLVQMSPYDPITIVSIVTILSAVSIAACLVPARRAARLDPVVALRYD